MTPATSVKDKKTMSFGGRAKWPLFLLANLAILFVVGTSTIRESYRGWTVDKEIETLDQKVKDLEGRKMDLTKLSQAMESPAYVEREARSKLDMKKPGEQVVVLEDFQTSQPSWELEVVPEPEQAPDLRSNPERWWDYFTQPKSIN